MFERLPVTHFNFFLTLIAVIILTGACSGTKNLNVQNPATGPDDQVDYTLIYMIHGDANYLYHQDGKEIRADQHALKKAFDVAVHATNGEVFIFHQKPESRALLFFPKKDRQFYHYKNGKLVDYQDYSPEEGGFEAEAKIYSERSDSRTENNYFLYYGHEVPMRTDISYYRSQPEFSFNADVFAEDLSLFGNFKLTVLSTCNNGTPYMMQQLLGKSEIVVASPQNLHLSYMDSDKILALNDQPGTNPVTLAESISEASFNRLTKEVTTTVSIAVYDLRIISEYIRDLYDPYLEYSSDQESASDIANAVDCMSLPEYKSLDRSDGVSVYYRESEFGKKSNESVVTHSGWGCK
jgi:hypothetical protein